MLVVVGLGLILAGCGAKKDVIDYSRAEHWLSIPTSTDKAVDVYKRIVVAYVVGFTITEDYLSANPYLKI